MELTLWLLFGVILLIGWLTVAKPRGTPPGPIWRFPFWGHVHFLQGDVFGSLKRLRQKYGDIFHLYIGRRQVVFLNGYDIIKDALVNNADTFSDRTMFRGYEEVGVGQGIILSSGHVWKEHRKFAIGALREFGFGRNVLQEKILEENDQFLSAVEKEKEQSFDISHLLNVAISNIICSIVFGKRFDYDDPHFHNCMQALYVGFKRNQAMGVVSASIAKRLPGDILGYQRLLRSIEFLKEELITPTVQEHIHDFDPNNARDFIDAYIKEMREKAKENAPTAITEDHLWRVIVDLFTAGSETTGTTLRWALVLLLRHPDLQERLHRELQDKVGSGRFPMLGDSPELPFLNAFILEVQRFGDIAPLALSHCVRDDVTFRGYRFPRGTVVFPVLHSVLRDPKVWGDPDVFRPERFLKDGKVVKPEEFIPFGIGRRMCLGESLAKMELFLFLSAMIQRFRFEPPENEAPPELKGVVEVTHSPQAFRMRAIRRQ